MQDALRARVHDVNGALAALHVELLQALERAPSGTEESYDLDSMLEATDALRRAFGEFIEASVREEEKRA